MNAHRSVTNHPPVTSMGQAHLDFTPQQIERLTEKAHAYPWIEFVESNQEWQRLVFLKWRYETGRVGR